jgi:hypothetical protein
MGIVDLVVDNYLDMVIASSVLFMIVFVVACRFMEESYGVGIVLLSVIVCSVAWPIFIPYILISLICDFLKVNKNAK